MFTIEKDPFDKSLYTFFRGCFGQYGKIRYTFISPFIITRCCRRRHVVVATLALLSTRIQVHI
jgi:hypothetical protein